ncbi:hypothetical protein TcG_02631, partial [Trypanosoma cruzi]
MAHHQMPNMFRNFFASAVLLLLFVLICCGTCEATRGTPTGSGNERGVGSSMSEGSSHEQSEGGSSMSEGSSHERSEGGSSMSEGSSHERSEGGSVHERGFVP